MISFFGHETFYDEKAEKSLKAKRWKKELNPLELLPFEIDISKIIYSDPFRRLSHKTQVFISRDLDQHSRTRLTHTLEVAQTAKTIGRDLGLNTNLIEAIALGHDLGHTPYGHAGEYVLNEKLKANGLSFNHNVQSVWLAQKLNYGLKDIDGKAFIGLNLTYKVLEGMWKHTDISGQLKEYEEGLKYLNPEEMGSLESQVVNIADSLSYLYHDISDAIRNKVISLEAFKNDVWKKIFDYDFNPVHWQRYFIKDIIKNSSSLEEIAFTEPYEKAYKMIRKYLYEEVICSKKIISMDEACKEKISRIYDYYIENPEIILNKNKRNNQYKLENYGKERLVVDYIQWLGDANADYEYKKITKAV